MKSLYKLICEMRFKNDDWYKIKYINPVINALCYNDSVRLGDNGDTIFNLTSEMKTYFKAEFEKNKNITLDDFNNIVQKYGLSWTKLFKGDFSGYQANTKGQRAEGLVCYMFNEPNADIELFKQQMMPDLTDEWIKSSKLTIDFLFKQKGISNISWTRDNYVACRVDGGDFKLSPEYAFAAEITSLFSGKATMKKIFKINCNDLYSGQKDIWNKADIVLVHKKLAKNLINDIKSKGVINGEMLNEFLIEYTKQGVIIPISLKCLTNDKIHLSSINIIEGEPADIVKSVKHIRIGDKYAENKYEGSITIVCETVDDRIVNIVFRASTSGKNDLSVEPQVTNDNSRLAKAVAVMKGMLNIKRGKEFYIGNKNTDTTDNAINTLKNYGFTVEIKPKSNYNTVIPELNKRACCAGLLGILNAYYNKLSKLPNGANNLPVKFANFCIFSAMGLNSKGAFYKVSN